jgi:hypothetical protein
VQLHPYIISLIAEDQIAQMHAQAKKDRLAQAAARQRKAAKHVSRDRALGHRVRVHANEWSSARHAGHSSPQEDSQLVSVGRAGSDDCV